MNVLKAIGRVFVGIGKGILAALRFAHAHGLDDDLLDLALSQVLQAHVRFDSNDERREWAVAQLTTKHVPESIARLAVELAVQKYKQRVS